MFGQFECEPGLIGADCSDELITEYLNETMRGYGVRYFLVQKGFRL